MLVTGAALAAASSVAVAQIAVPAATEAKPEKPSVDGYVCKFAHVCEPVAASDIEKAAPGTRTFQLGRSGATRVAGVPTGSPAVAETPRSSTRDFASQAASNVRYGGTSGAFRPSSRVRHPLGSGAGRPVAGLAGTRPGRVSVPGGVERADLMIGFDLNSAQLSADGRESARIFAQALLQPTLLSKRFVVEGHTDLRGGRPLNLALSMSRARAVVDFLAAQGVDRSRLQARGLGPDVPLAGHRAADPANRRVEAELLP